MAFNTSKLIDIALLEFENQLDKGMHSQAAIRYSLISAVFTIFGLPTPAILSGFRTLIEQRLLRDRLGAKAATRSWHTVGLAYDIDTGSPTFDLFASFWTKLGGRDGQNFFTPDRGHFDFPIESITPPPI